MLLKPLLLGCSPFSLSYLLSPLSSLLYIFLLFEHVLDTSNPSRHIVFFSSPSFSHLSIVFFLLSYLSTWYQSAIEEEIDLSCERNLPLPAGGSLPYRTCLTVPLADLPIFRVVLTVFRRCSAPPRRRCSASPRRGCSAPPRPAAAVPRRPDVALRLFRTSLTVFRAAQTLSRAAPLLPALPRLVIPHLPDGIPRRPDAVLRRAVATCPTTPVCSLSAATTLRCRHICIGYTLRRLHICAGYTSTPVTRWFSYRHICAGSAAGSTPVQLLIHLRCRFHSTPHG